MWSLPIGAVIAVALGPANGLMAATGCLVGGLWLSPDLDTHSNALRRWGPLGWIWWPYRRCIPHRSLWSHGPFIGTALRLAVLVTWCSAISLLVPFHPPMAWLSTLDALFKEHPRAMASLLVGIEASAWLHLILDGDPWPVEWSLRRKRRRR